MGIYKVVDIDRDVFAPSIQVSASSPKEAAEKAIKRNVKRAFFGEGTIVVYGMCESRSLTYCRSYVYKVI